MPHKTYSKPALTTQQQVELLTRQGLYIENRSSAQHALSLIGYYRFSAYLLPFKEPHQERMPRTFKAGTTFEQVLNLYLFDRELKQLVSDGIGQIEIAFRTAITNITAVEINPFWYTERTFYKDAKPFDNLMRDVNQIIKNKPELFIEHYYANY
ncbi:MAG: Abi family protein, partial [Gammaproteobacteria bacterium]